jgi:hypothetical protein
MYFPYFRGRQYELLALKELAVGNLFGKSVIPVVEPVKKSSTFTGFIDTFKESQSRVALVFNPAVGDLVNDHSWQLSILANLGRDACMLPSVLLNCNAKNTIDALFEAEVPVNDVLTIVSNRDDLDLYNELFDSVKPKFTLCPDERYIRHAINQNKVLFADKFNKQNKNADYPPDEPFSDDHLYFENEGYLGFGDYSIIGNVYTESGFAPYAVAIHIVYFAEDMTLRVRHFLSDSNVDTSDVAGKFGQAVSKLREWYNNGQEHQNTLALSILLSHAEKGYYPGLPTIKKLSIMHHIELMGKYLDGDLSK